MILAIDVGNTHIVIGMIEDGEIKSVVRLHTDPRETATELIIKLRQITEYYGLDPTALEGSILSSVVPRVTQTMKTALETLTGKRAMLVGPGMKTGLNLRIDEPASVASDLVVGSVAAAAIYGAPVIVVSMRTATTLVVTDAGGVFRGGAILPGVKLGYGALAAGTSLLPEIAVLPPKKVIGANTVDAMRAGAVYGTAAMLDGMLERMEAELGCACTVVATGGLAREVVPCCKRADIIVDPDLMLKGLWLLYRKNR
ncbi:MAG: type III pantothenate kinase [Oscillospiraceae bacterium]|nr:type III pantothenate kinase [Oscillospiraceae bacterium]